MTTAPVRPTTVRPVTNPFTPPVPAMPAPVVSTVSAQVVAVTPVIAREWLRLNNRNRVIRPARVNAYARQMTKGLWTVNGEAIKIATNNDILDGQHRLLAVVKSGVTIHILVVTGLPPETQDTMDGGAKRSSGDVFGLRGEQNATILGSVARKVWLYNSGDRRFSAGENPSTPELVALLDENPGLRRSADIAVRVYHSFRYIPPSVVGCAHHLSSRIDPDAAAWFYERLGTGAELAVRHPVLTLRKRVMTDKDNNKLVPDGLHLAQVLTAWNAVRDDKTLAAIKVPLDSDGKFQLVDPK
jgi:hypothetical protein